jgi:outer membrane receptor protein involved in Fe transport
VNVSSDTRAAFNQDTGSLFGRRVKAVFSPRVSVSHPIQNKDKFFFNFGQFTQFPSYYYVYSKLTSVSSAGFPVLGNANLNPEKSVQFEVGAQHVFADQSAGKITLFQKDIYDYPTSVLFHRQEGTVISDFFAYLNSDFSRARGFELEFESPRKGFWKYRGSYEFSVAKGKSSDPNQAKIVEEGGGDAAEPPLSEGYLFWNRPHKFTLNADYRVPNGGDRPHVLGVHLPHGFGANLFASMQSGKPYTPTDVNGNATGRVFSHNGPIELLVNLRLNQDFAVTKQNRMNFYVMAENLLNWKIVKRLDPSTGQSPTAGEGEYVNPTQYEINSVLDNPGIYGPPLRVRLGLDYDF